MTCCCGVIAGGLLTSNNSVGLSAGDITHLVGNAGGNIDAFFRASMAWASWSDLDLHLKEPGGDHIYFSNKKSSITNGELDVDMNVGSFNQIHNDNKYSLPAVENIMYPNDDNMPDGIYEISYVQFGVNEERQAGADRPYLLIEHRTPDEPRMSHYVLLKQTGNNLNVNKEHNELLAKVRKTGNKFKLVELPPNTKIIKNHNFDIGSYRVSGGNSTQTGNIAESGANPTGA